MTDVDFNEIYLFDLFKTVIKHRWLLFIINFTALILLVLYVVFVPATYKTSVPLSQLEASDMAAYKVLNALPDLSNPIYSQGVLVGQTGVIKSKDLFLSLEKHLINRTFFAEAIEKFDPAFENGELDERAKKIALESRIKAFKYERRTKKTGTEITPLSGDIHIVTNDRETALKIVEHALDASFNEVRLRNLEAINQIKSAIEMSNNFLIGEIDSQIQSHLSAFEAKSESRIQHLEEQAKLARQLGIKDPKGQEPLNIGIDIKIEEDEAALSSNNSQLYLRGYKVLKNEIALIEQRDQDSKLAFISEYPDLVAQKMLLQKNERPKQIKQALLATPLLMPEDFKPANYELDAIIFNKTISSALFIILGLLVSTITSVVFVWLLGAFVERKSAQS